MTLTEGAIKYNRFTLVVLASVFLFSMIAWNSMSRSEDPKLTFRFAQILTYLPGASPRRMEELVTDKIEKVLQEVPELDHHYSTSKTGVSIVMFQIQDRYFDLQPIFDNVRRKLNRVREDLPSGVIGPDLNDEFGDVFGIVMSLTGEGYTYAQLKEVADDVRDDLLVLDQVSKVELHGIQEERIFLEYDNTRLARVGLSPGQLLEILSSRNIITPGGSIVSGEDKLIIEPSGNYETLEDLKRTVIAPPRSDQLIYLEDLVEVRRDYIDPPQSVFHFSGTPGIAIAISLRKGGNIIELGKEVRAIEKHLLEQNPIGIDFGFIAFQPDLVDARVSTFVGNLLQAIGVVSLVILMFLGIRTGLIVASAVPTSIMMCFVFMGLFDIGIEQVSLAALIIALGMLVDNAIVMVESILTQAEEGKPVFKAAVDSAQELGAALLVASLTTAAAFLPQFIAESGTAEYTASLFKVVTITLLCSWVLALTLIPLLCVLFLRCKRSAPDEAAGDQSGNLFDTRAYHLYRNVLCWVLRNRTVSLLAVFAMFYMSLQAFALVPKLFFPQDDRIYVTAEFELPFGTPIERSIEVISDIEKFIARELQVREDQPRGVEKWGSFIGSGGTRFQLNWIPAPPSPEYSFLLLNTTDPEIRGEVIAKLEDYVFNHYPDMHMEIKRTFYGPPVPAAVAVRLIGEDEKVLYQIADRVSDQLRTIPGTKFVTDDWGSWFKKIQVNIDQARARRASVSSKDIATSLQANFDGLVATEFRENEDLVPVVLRSTGADRDDLAKLESIEVYSQATGQAVSLKQVADLEVVWEPGLIRHRYGRKTITVLSQLQDGATAAAIVAQIKPYMDEISSEWGFGYEFEIAGEAADSAKDQQAVAAKMPIGAIIILLLLVWQFNSIRRPLIILLTIPLSLIGVFFGLLVGQSYFGFMTFLGVVSLAGIVINNAIVLIDRIELEINEYGRDAKDAIIEASQRRFRPILLTTATTAVGLLPLWFGGGLMFEPMAIAIIFGLVFATILTLGVVPILYSLFFRVSFQGYRYAAN